MSTQQDKLKAIADAIREKDGSTGTIVANDFADRIRAIQTGTDTSDANATASDILSGKTAYVKGSKVTGTIASKEAADVTVSGATVSIPAGNYKSAVSKSVTTVTHPAPTQSLTLGTYATIKASHTQGAGYVSSGTTTHNYNITRHSGGTYNPSSSSYQALSSGLWYLNNPLYIGASTFSIKRDVSVNPTIQNNMLTVPTGVTEPIGIILGVKTLYTSWITSEGTYPVISIFYFRGMSSPFAVSISKSGYSMCSKIGSSNAYFDGSNFIYRSDAYPPFNYETNNWGMIVF